MARLQTRKQAAVTTGAAESSGIPCAMVLTVSFVLSPGTGFVAPVSRQRASALRWTPAPGRQDHTTSPYASIPFVRTREACCEPLRPPHPRLACRDDRAQRPSVVRRDD